MELYDLIEKYNKTFKSGYPMYTLSGWTKTEQTEIILKCLEEKKDVYELGIVEQVSRDIII